MNLQKGMALIVSLVVLVVAALLGLSTFQSAQLEEKMSGNYRFSVSALQAAEAGVNDMLTGVMSYTYSPTDPFCDNLGSNMGYGSTGVSGIYYKDGDFSGGNLVKKFRVVVKCIDSGESGEAKHVLGYSRGVVLDDDSQELSARRLRVEIVPPGFDTVRSMLSDQNISIPGNSTIIGDVHSNQNVDLAINDNTGKKSERMVSEGTITATGDVSIKDNSSSTTDGDCDTSICGQSGVPRINVPSAQDQIDIAKNDYMTEDRGVTLEAYDETVFGEPTNTNNYPEHNPVLLPLNEDGQQGSFDYPDLKILPHDPDTGLCDINAEEELVPSEFDDGGAGQGNKIYYCPGELKVAGDFGGITLMAEGNITHTGASSVNADGDIDTLVVSGGDITLDGKQVTETHASYFAEGSFTQNGTADIYGVIVSGQGITINGGVDFIARDTGMIDILVSGHLEGWSESELSGDDSDLVALLDADS